MACPPNPYIFKKEWCNYKRGKNYHISKSWNFTQNQNATKVLFKIILTPNGC